MRRVNRQDGGQAMLNGKTVLVTGASSGLGRHFATMLAGQGAQVVAAARRAEALADLCADIAAQGGQAHPLVMDVTDAASVAEGVAGIGRIDGLVNCSGITQTVRLLDQTESDWARIIDTNLTGTWRVLRAVAARMAAQGGGSIVNIASILGLRQGGQVTAYATSKAAVVQLTQQSALELARHGIRVNALCPGYIETDLNRDFFATEPGRALIARIPQRRLGQLADLDAPLQMLLGDGSAYMTGSVIAVDGGHLVGSL
jgi:NAD(P)-dependent dehydrogenase (short-subunit alcohol dehydrogenase family)